jgi:hypothetical protein
MAVVILIILPEFTGRSLEVAEGVVLNQLSLVE